MTRAREMADLASSAGDLTTVAADASVLAAQADGYTYRETVTFTSSGTFTKASYPWLRAIRVKVQGGGGGGGGVDDVDNIGDAVGASGGGAGVYAESFLTDIDALASSVTVTVGAGGAGGPGGRGSGPAGVAEIGGWSYFGQGQPYEVSAQGGDEGVRGFESIGVGNQRGATSVTGGTGQIVIGGEGTEASRSFGSSVSSNVVGQGTSGGSSPLGSGGRAVEARDEANPGLDGNGYGSGGSGAAASAESSTFNGSDGGNGAPGVVIVELYA